MNKRMRQFGMFAQIMLVTALFAGAFVSSAFALDCNDQASGNWSTSGTWTSCGGGTPDGDDNVTIDTFNVTLDADEKVNNLIISTGSLDLDGYNLTIFGSLDLDGTLLADSGTGGNATITIEGTWDMTNGVFTSTDSTVIFIGTSSYDITSDGKAFNNFIINGTIGLVGYWPLNETSSPAIDYSGNNINGTWVGVNSSIVTSTDINFNNPGSADFDGSNDTILFGDRGNISGSPGITVSAWIRPAATAAASNTILWRGQAGGSTRAYSIYFASTDELSVRVTTTSTGTLASFNYVTSSSPITPVGIWYHVAYTYSDADDTIRVYSNGSQVGSNVGGATGTMLDGATLLQSGTADANQRDFNGLIDELRLYNRALTPTEISNMASGNMPGGGLGTYTLQDNFDANGTVTLNDGELDIGSSILRNVGGSWLNHGGVFTVGGGGGQTTFDGSGTILSGSQTFRDVAISASGTYTLWDNIAVESGFDVNAGTLTYATSTIIQPITVYGAAQLSGTGVFTGQATDFRFNDSLNIMAGTFTAPTGVLEVGGDFDHTGGTFTNSSSTVMFTGTQTHDFNPSASTMFNNLVVEAGAGSYTLQADLDINGTLRLGSGTLDVSATDYQINVASHWINSGGTFIEQNGTVVLDGTTQSILSSEAFYHLSKTDPTNNNADVTLTFTAGTTTTVAGSLTLDGIDDLDRVNLLSSSPGTRFNLSVTGTPNTSWLDVTDSEALGTDINSLNSLQSNTDAGEGSPQWNFSAVGDISGTTDLGDGIDVLVAVNGVLQAEMTTTSGGAWTISSVTMGENTHVVVWADNVADGSEANGVTVYDGAGNITGMVLNTGTLSIGSATDNPTVNMTGLALFDNDEDEDIIFTSNSGTLLVDADNVVTDEGLNILTNGTLTLSSTEGIDGEDIVIDGVLNLTATNNIILNGTPDWTNNGSFNAGTGTVTIDRGGTAGASTIIGPTTFYGLTLDASSTNDIEIYSNLTVSNDFRIEHTGAGSSGYGVDAVSGPHNITLLGDFIHAGTTNVDPNVNIVFNGTGTQTITSLNTPQLPSLQISNTAASVELATDILVSGTMRIDASATLDVTASNYMITMQGVGLGITDWVNSGSFVPQTGTVTFEANGGTGDVQILSPTTFYNFEIDGASSADLYIGAALLIQNDFTNSHTGSGQVFDSGGPFDIDVQGDVYLNGNQDLDVDLNVQMTGTTTQTVFYTSTGGFGDFQVSNTLGEVVMAGTLEVADDILVDVNTTLDLRDEGVDGEGITIFTVNGTLELEGDQNFISATPTFSTTSWAEYTATGGTRNIQSWAYDSLEINGAGGTFTLPGDIVLVDEYRGRDGILDTDDMGVPTAMFTVGGTFELIGGNFTANSSTISIANDILIGTTGGLFTAGTSTVIFNGSMNVSSPTESNAFYNGLQANGTTLTLTGSVAFDSTGTFTTGDVTSTIQTNGSAQEFMMFGSSVVADGGVVWTSATATGDLQLAYFGNSRTTGGGNYGLTNFTVEIDDGNTLTLGGSLRVGQFNYVSPNVGDDLTFDANGFTVQADTMQIGMLGFTDRYATFNAQTSTVEITTDFTIYPSDASGDNIFDGQMSYMDIGDDWLNQDTFTPGTSTVNFSGTVIDITGSTTFYNLIIEETVNDFTDVIVTFEAGSTYVIEGTMRINGLDASDRVNLYSSIPGTRWNISVTAGVGNADFIDVTDSEVVGSNDIHTANTLDTSNNDSGEGTPEWIFTIPGTINISGSSNLPGGTTIRVAATGSLQGMPTTTTAGDGSWTLMNAPGIAIDEVIVVWADSVAESSETTGVTLYDGAGNITGMILTTNILTIGSDEDTVTTIADLSVYDNDDNEDVMFTANAGILNVDGAGTYTDGTLQILSGDTLTIGATETLTVNNVVITGTLNTTGVATINVTDGNWGNTGLFVESTSVVTMNSTSGDTNIISGTSTFYDLSLLGGGTYRMTTGELIADNSFVTTDGTLDVNDQTLTINTDVTLTNFWLQTGTGVVTFGDAGADSVVVSSGTVTIESDATDSDIVLNANTWTNTSGLVIYDGASSSTSVFSAIAPYYNLTVDSVGNTFTANTAITVNGTLNIVAGTVDLDGYNTQVVGNAIISGAFDLGSGAGGNVTGTFNGNWDATGGTFTATDSTVILSGTVNQTLTSNSNPFNNLEINGSFGLVGYWKFDETASPTIDSSGNGLSGTWGGGTNSSTLIGDTTFDNQNSLFFDGSDDSVFFGDVGNISGSSGVTISAWIRPTAIATASNSILWRGQVSGSTRGYSLYYASTDELTFRVTTTSTGAGGNAAFSTSSSPISTLNVWYHVLATYSDTDDTMRIYVNGTQVASSGATASGTMLDNGTLLQSGTADPLQRDFNGYIDDLRLYNRGVSAATAQHLANGDHLSEYTIQDILDVNGTLTINNGHLDVGANNTINAAESWLNYGGVFTASMGQVNFDGATGSHSILSGAQSFYNVDVTGAATWSLDEDVIALNLFDISAGVITYTTDASLIPITLTGPTTLTGGTFTGTATHFRHNGSVDISVGTYTAPTGLLEIDGAFTHSGGTFTNSSSTVMFGATTSVNLDTSAGTIFHDVIFNDGLVGYWKFDETVSPAFDYSGYGAHGDWMGGTTFTSNTATEINFNNPYAIDFDGSNDYIVAPHREAHNTGPGSITIALWVFAVDGSSDEVFIRKMESTPPTGGADLQFNVEYDDGANNFDFYFSNTAGALQGPFSVPVSTVAQWNHVAFSYDGANVRGYLNGTNTLTTAETDLMFEGEEVIHFGTDGAYGQDFSGELDEARVYSRVLSDAEIQRLANGNMPGTGLGTYTLQTDLDINGSLILNDGTLNTGTNRTITVEDNWMNHGGILSATSGTIQFNGTTTDNQILSGSQTFFSAEITGSGTWTLQDNLPVTGTIFVPSGVLTYATDTNIEPVKIIGGTDINGGTFTGQAADFEHEGTLRITSGTYTTSTLDTIMDGSFIHAGGTFTNSSATVVFVGTDTHSIDTTGGGIFNDVVFRDGLIGYWKFDELASPAIDYSGYGNNGTWNDSPTITTATTSGIDFQNPLALEFDAGSDRIAIGTTDTYSNLEKKTISVWVRVGDQTTDGRIVAKQDSTTVDPGWDFIINPSETLQYRHRWTGDFVTWSYTTTLTIGSWYHLAVTYDYSSTTNDPVIYVNGSAVAISQSGTPSGNHTDDAGVNLNIGNTQANSRDFIGILDDVRIYNRILTAVEISTLANGNPAAISGSYTLQTDMNVSGTFTMVGNSLDVGSDRLITTTGNWLNYGGNFIEQNGTVIMDAASGAISIYQTDTFYNLQLNDGGGTTTFTQQSDMDINGSLSITDGTLDANATRNYSIQLAGNWVNNDVFTARTGTVELDGITQTIGTTDPFYNLASFELTDDGVDRNLTFIAGSTYTINGTLSLRGLDDSDRVNIMSDTPGTRFAFDVTDGNQRARFLDVTDSESSSNDILASRSNDVLNNDTDEVTPFWIITIGEIYDWTGASDNITWEDQGNWDIGDSSQGNDGFPDDNFDLALILTSSDNIDTPSGTLTLAGLYVDSDFTGSLTLTGTIVADDAMAFTGDVDLLGGTYDHLDNTTSEASKFVMIIDGSFTLGSMAQIIVDGLGYDADNGPGTANNEDGGSYGGIGGDDAGGGTISTTYGSIIAPVNIGSGGDNASGGGAVILTVTGTTTINGTITAEGAPSTNGAGSGGGVFITTNSITGTGTLLVNGGDDTGGNGAGGGGRIAIVLTGVGENFNTYTGTMNAFGGESTVDDEDGAAGTIYQEIDSQLSGQGTLTVDNDNGDTIGGVYTLLPASVDMNDFATIILRNNGDVAVGNDDMIDFTSVDLTVSGADESFLTIVDDAGVTFPANYTISNYTLNADGLTAVTSNLTIANNSALSHSQNGLAENYTVNFILTGSLIVDSGGQINAATKGYLAAAGPGAPSGGGEAGGAYGGRGGDESIGSSASNTYGSITAPVNIGSGGNADSGGGAIILTVTGTTTVDGTLTVAGEDSNFGSGAGGSIYLTTGFLSGTGTLIADGGDDTAGNAAGGGGRIALILTDASADFTGWTGTITAYGGDSTDADEDGAAGTVYLESGIQGSGNGILTIDNNNLDPESGFTITALDDEDANIATVVGSLIIQNDGYFVIGADDWLTVGGTNDTLFVESGSRIDNEGTLSLSGDFFSTFGATDFAAIGNTVIQTGEDGSANPPVLNTTFYNLTIDNSTNTFTQFATNLDVNGTFTLNAGIYQQNERDLSVAGNFIINTNGTFEPSVGGSLFLDGDQTYYDYTSPQQDVGRVVADPTTTLGTDMTAMSLKIEGNDTFVTDGYNLYLSGTMDINGTLVASSGTGGNSDIHVGGLWDATSGLMTMTDSTVMFTGTTSGLTITSNAQSFNNLIVNSGSIGLVGYWKLDETTGTIAKDFSGFAHNGSYEGNPVSSTTVSGTINYNNPASLDFDASGDVVRINNSSSIGHKLDFTAGPFSMGAWVRAHGPNGTIIGKRDGGSANRQYQLSIENGTGNTRFHWGGQNEDAYGSDTIVQLNTWYHLFVVVDSSGDPQIYINGVAETVADANGTRPHVFTHQSTDISIGARWAGDPATAFLFDGEIDEVRIYGRALSAIEISHLANGNMPATGLGTYTLQDAFTVAGTLTLNDGTLVQSGADMSITFGWLNHGGIFTANPSIIMSLGANSGPYPILSGSQTFGGIELLGVGTYELQDDLISTSSMFLTSGNITYATSTIIEPITITGNLNATGGNTGDFIGISTRFKIDGDVLFTAAGATFTAPTDVLEITGSFTHTAGTFTNSSSTVMFSGTATDSVINASGATFQDLIINDGLVGYWPLDETASGAQDKSGYANNGVWQGALSSTTTIPTVNFANPRAIDVTASTTYVDVPHSDSLKISTTEMTIAAWVRFDTFTGGDDPSIFEKNPDFNLQLGVAGASDNQPRFRLNTTSGVVTVGSGPALSTGQWYHLAGVYDGSQMYMYQDGVVVDMGAQTGAIDLDNSDVHIGVRTGNGAYIDGQIDDVRFYDRALSASEVQRLVDGNQPSTGLGTYTLASTLDVDGTLRLNAGTLDVSASDYQVNVISDWENFGGIFNARTGTVVLDGGDQWLPASETFYNIKKQITSPSTVTFGRQSTITIGGTFAFDGFDASNLLFLRSSSVGTRFNIDVASTQSALFLNVTDSEALSNNIRTKNSVDGGNTDSAEPPPRWIFGPLRGAVIIVD